VISAYKILDGKHEENTWNTKAWLKGKVKLFLCLTKHYAMKAYGRVDV
jgi:hypothetical protein